jgi:hypothetical protein
MSRNHSKNLSLTFFVPANPPSWGIRGGISKKLGFVRAIVLQLGDTLELKWSYNPPYWSSLGRARELMCRVTSCYKLDL